jgi:hypothetical protein
MTEMIYESVIIRKKAPLLTGSYNKQKGGISDAPFFRYSPA